MVRMICSAIFASALIFTHAQDYDSWAAAYGKIENGNDERKARRRARFEANKASIEAFNRGGHRFKKGLNQFSDLTMEEYEEAAALNAKPPSELDSLPVLGVHVHNGEELASSVSWIDRGAVTPVKNQGNCGSCWAFSAVGATEGGWQINSGKLVTFSEQQLVDCCSNQHGCGGGWPGAGFDYYSKNNVASASSYPYRAKDGACKQSFSTVIHAGVIAGTKNIGHTKNDLMSAIQQQPVSIALSASSDSFRSYHSGVMDDKNCATPLNHAVLAVGYGNEEGLDYWFIKNSWGSGWGDRGYIRISSSSDVCSVLKAPHYPVFPPSPSPSPTPGTTTTTTTTTTPSPGPSPPPPSPHGSCESRCNSAGHCCTGRTSSYNHPSCAMGCAIAAEMDSTSDCKKKCHKSDNTCNWLLRRKTEFDNCGGCPSGCDASGGVQECLDGCDYFFSTDNSSAVVV